MLQEKPGTLTIKKNLEGHVFCGEVFPVPISHGNTDLIFGMSICQLTLHLTNFTEMDFCLLIPEKPVIVFGECSKEIMQLHKKNQVNRFKLRGGVFLATTNHVQKSWRNIGIEN